MNNTVQIIRIGTQTYVSPAIIYEAVLEVQAGSSLDKTDKPDDKSWREAAHWNYWHNPSNPWNNPNNTSIKR
jgi:hypothetical protein